MAERLNAAVLKTVLVKANGGSNPSFSANEIKNRSQRERFFYAPINFHQVAPHLSENLSEA